MAADCALRFAMDLLRIDSLFLRIFFSLLVSKVRRLLSCASVRACVRVNVSTSCVQAARGIMDALTRVAISQALEQRVFDNDSGDTNDGMTAHHNARAVCAIADTWRPCRWAQTPA